MKNKKTKKSQEVIKVWHDKNKNIPSDVMGSYTGNPQNKNGSPYEKPVQDADDL